MLARIELPIPRDGEDGIDGVDGVGIASFEIVGDTIFVTLSDGSKKTIGPLGFLMELYGPKGRLMDSEWIPINGKLRLRQSVLSAE